MAAIPSVRKTTTAMSARVTPRSLRRTIVLRIRHSLPPPPGGPSGLVLLLDQSNALDQRARWAPGRAAAGHESQKPAGYRLFAAAVPRARAPVDEHFGQVVELNGVTARTPAVLRGVIQPDNDDT